MGDPAPPFWPGNNGLEWPLTVVQRTGNSIRKGLAMPKPCEAFRDATMRDLTRRVAG